MQVSGDRKREGMPFFSLSSFCLPEILAEAPETILDKRVTFGYWTVTFPFLDNEGAIRSKDHGSLIPWITDQTLIETFGYFTVRKRIYLIKPLLFVGFLQPRAELNSN